MVPGFEFLQYANIIIHASFIHPPSTPTITWWGCVSAVNPTHSSALGSLPGIGLFVFPLQLVIDDLACSDPLWRGGEMEMRKGAERYEGMRKPVCSLETCCVRAWSHYHAGGKACLYFNALFSVLFVIQTPSDSAAKVVHYLPFWPLHKIIWCQRVNLKNLCYREGDFS